MTKADSSIEAAEDFEFQALRHATNYRQALFREFQPYLHGSVIESGAGIGQMTELLHQHDEVLRFLCVEPNPQFCSQIRARFPTLKPLCGTICDVPESSVWNAIVSVNVLEHIEDDRAELQSYGQLLRGREGHLCLIVPARPEIYGTIDQSFGHFRRYTKADLRQKLTVAGFRMEKLTYFNLLGYLGWWMNFRLLDHRRFSPIQVKLFDSIVFPVTNWFETHVLRPPIGQSLIAIAQAQ